MQQIRTKWHKIQPLIETDEVYLTAPKDGRAAHWSEFQPRREATVQLINDLGKLPKFVIDKELLQIANKENYQQSFIDMEKAGVLRLPFPAMLVEFDSLLGHRVIVLLRDNQSPDLKSWEPPKGKQDFRDRAPFYGMIFRIESDQEGDYLVLCPSVLTIGVKKIDDKAWLQVWAMEHDLMASSAALNKLVGLTYEKDATFIWRALCAAMLLMHTDGVVKEVIECEKLNRKRRNSNKPLIPKHTYLHIGRVYKSTASEESDEYVPRKSPIPHWRRGHLKNVRHGPKHTLTKAKYINPKLVAFKGYTSEEPSVAKEYHVSK